MTEHGKEPEKLDWRLDGICLILLAIVGFLLRATPELQVQGLPIGYDVGTAYLKAVLELDSGQNYLTLASLWPGQSLLYVIFQITKVFFHGDPVGLIKVVGVALFLFTNSAAYIFLRKGLRLDYKPALIATLLYMLDLGTLRISWDLFRNELALGFLFLGLTSLLRSEEDSQTIKQLGFAILWFALVLVSHQIVSVLLLVLAGIYVLQRFRPIGLWVLGAGFAGLFLLPLASKLSIAGSPILDTVVGPMDRVEPAVFLGFLYLLQIPFVIIGLLVGLKRLTQSAYMVLAGWMLFVLLIVVSSVVFYPNTFLLWDRWSYLLPLPMAVFTFLGIEYVSTLNPLRLVGSTAVSFLLVAILCYRGPSFALNPQVDRESIPHASFPSSLSQTSVGYEKQHDAYERLVRATDRLPDKSVLVVASRYRGIIDLWGIKPTLRIIQSDLEDDQSVQSLIEQLSTEQQPVFVFDAHRIRTIVDTRQFVHFGAHSIVQLLFAVE